MLGQTFSGSRFVGAGFWIRRVTAVGSLGDAQSRELGQEAQSPEKPSPMGCSTYLQRRSFGGVLHRAYGRDEDESWSRPPSVFTWGMGVPLKTVRFAAADHLLVEPAYEGRTRLIEPYSLRRTRAGNLVLHAERPDGSGHRSYRFERIQGLRTATTPFRPRFPIEFSSRGPLHAPPQYRTLVPPASRTSSRSRASSTSREYLHEYTGGRQFAHTQRNATLRRHDDQYGYRCSGPHGTYVGERY
jgi:hypothetical protein